MPHNLSLCHSCILDEGNCGMNPAGITTGCSKYSPRALRDPSNCSMLVDVFIDRDVLVVTVHSRMTNVATNRLCSRSIRSVVNNAKDCAAQLRRDYGDTFTDEDIAVAATWAAMRVGIDIHTTLALVGWTCPNCGQGLSPFVQACLCGPRTRTSTVVGTGSPIIQDWKTTSGI